MSSQLTVQERDRIAQLRHEGADQQEIATALGRAPSTISREVRRNSTGEQYYAGQAQRECERRRRERPLVRKLDDPELNEAVRAGLAQAWSPEQITGRMEQQHPECPLCANMSETPALPFITVEGEEGKSHGEDDEQWLAVSAGGRP